jgi:hypothetical protein
MDQDQAATISLVHQNSVPSVQMPVQDHSDLAGNSNARLLRSSALGQPCPPSFERGPTLHLREKDIGSLVQARSSEPISAFRDVAMPICFPD